MTLALLAYALAQIADVITTRQALRRPGVVEGNPVVLALMDRLGGWWVVAKLALTGAAVAVLWWADLPWVILGVAVAVAVVAWGNTRRGR